jgi:fibro-slime domain-containing protein
MNQACAVTCGNGNIELGEACDDGNTNSGDGCSAICALETGFMCAATPRTDAEPCQGGSGQCLRLPAVIRDFKNESVSGGHPDFFYMGATVANPVNVSGVQGQAPTISFSKRYCVADAAGPAKQQSAVNRSWNLAAPNLGTTGKPVFNSTRTNGTLSDCQFIDWSHNGNSGHVPGYGDAGTPGHPLSGLAYTVGEPQGLSPMYRGLAPMVTSPDTFAQWFIDSTYTGNTHAVKTLDLAATTGGGYQFLPNTHEVYGGFFPFDPPGQFPAAGGTNGPGAVRTVGTEALQCNIWPYWYSSAQFGAGNNCRGDQYLFPPSVDAGTYPKGTWVANVQGWFHDFWFTTEIRTLFTYTGTFRLDVAATDDFYAFINGVLVVDLGGTHQRIPAHVELSGVTGTAAITEGGRVDPTTGGTPACPSYDPYTGLFSNGATNSDGVGHMNCTTPDCDCRSRAVNLGLQLNRTYELAMFAADRHCPEYNLDIGLSGLGGNISACLPRCGDALIAGGEQCDCGDGVSLSSDPSCGGMANSDSVYGGCTTQCKFGPYCGDGMVNGNEQCDLGAKSNTGSYGTGGCTPACRTPHRCGDGILDTWAGEQCDLGDASNGTAGSPCSVICGIATPPN